MWYAMVFSVMLAVAGYYSGSAPLVDEQAAAARNLATSMAIYRQLLIAYATAHPSATARNVPLAQLTAYFPLGYTQESAQLWRNYVDSDGILYVYPARALALSITNELVALSQNSVLVGDAGIDGNLHAPANLASFDSLPPAVGHTSTDIPLPPGAAISAGLPVWLAFRN